jgi:hypothetical protein
MGFPIADGTLGAGLSEDHMYQMSDTKLEPRPVPVPVPAPAPKPASEPLPKEVGGPAGPEPTRYGDWEQKGRCTDF